MDWLYAYNEPYYLQKHQRILRHFVHVNIEIRKVWLDGKCLFQVPNATGFLFGTIQLVLYAIYRRSKGSEQVSDDLEDAWQHEQLLPSSSPNVS